MRTQRSGVFLSLQPLLSSSNDHSNLEASPIMVAPLLEKGLKTAHRARSGVNLSHGHLRWSSLGANSRSARPLCTHMPGPQWLAARNGMNCSHRIRDGESTARKRKEDGSELSRT